MKEHGKDRLEKATYQPGDYGRMIRPDGTEQWWVRSPKGIWIALRHQRVMPNEDGSITLLSLEVWTALHAMALGLTILSALLPRANLLIE
jgi:hypothetical protein